MRGRFLKREIDDLREDISQLREDASAVLESLLDAGKGQASEIREKLGSNAERWLGDLKERFADVGQQGRKMLSKAYKEAEQRPVTTFLVAFAAVLLAGRLLYRR